MHIGAAKSTITRFDILFLFPVIVISFSISLQIHVELCNPEYVATTAAVGFHDGFFSRNSANNEKIEI